MLDIGSFFARFRSRELEEITFRAGVIDAVREVLGFDLGQDDFSYSHGVINLKISPAARAAVFLKKELLLKKIQEKVKREVKEVR